MEEKNVQPLPEEQITDLTTIPDEAEIIAADVRQIVFNTRAVAIGNSIEIGRRLCRAKELVPHGAWGTWLKERVEFSERQAQNFMKVYNERDSLHKLLFASSNPQTPADLSLTKALQLLTIPAEEREEFVEQNNALEMSSRELAQAIKERDEARQDACRAWEQVEENRLTLEDAEAQKKASLEYAERAREQVESAIKRAEEAEAARDTAKAKQEKAVNAAVKKATKEVEANLAGLTKEHEEAKKALGELEKKVTEADANAKAAATEAEAKAREEAKAEADKLREHIADLERKVKAASNPAVQKFGVYFEQFQQTFNVLLSTLAAIEDADLQGRFRAAITEVLRAFGEAVKEE